MPASGDAARHPGAGEHRGLKLGGKVPSDAIKALVIRLGGVEAIIGHSFGAACALLALDNQQRLSNKLALIGCPPDGIWVTEQFGAILGVKAGTLARMRALLGTFHRRNNRRRPAGRPIREPFRLKWACRRRRRGANCSDEPWLPLRSVFPRAHDVRLECSRAGRLSQPCRSHVTRGSPPTRPQASMLVASTRHARRRWCWPQRPARPWVRWCCSATRSALCCSSA